MRPGNSRLYSPLSHPLRSRHMMSGMTSSATFPGPIHLFEMKGRDARDFLNRMTTVNIRDLQDGDFRPGFLLSPMGKIRASFRIAALGKQPAEEYFLIEIEGGKNSHWKTAFLAVLEQFTFTEKYELREITGQKCAWIFGLSKASENRCETRGTLTFLHGTKKLFGTNWTSIWGKPTAVDEFLHSQATTLLSDIDFERLRILSLAPRIDAEILPDSNPLELGLREGISDNKGCYPGQEVIEKIISLGSPAKRLAKLTGTGNTPQVGDHVFFEGAEVGHITSACKDETGFSALALLRKNAAAERQILTVNEIKVTVERIADYE